MLGSDARRRLKMFLVTVGISGTAFLGFHIVDTNNDAGWRTFTAIPEVSEVAPASTLIIQENALLDMDMWGRSFEKADPTFGEDHRSVIMLFVVSASSCPLVFNDIVDFTGLAMEYDLYPTTVIIPENDYAFDVNGFQQATQWVTPVFTIPRGILPEEIGMRIGNIRIYRHVIFVDRLTGRLINYGQLSTSVIPLRKKREIVGTTLAAHAMLRKEINDNGGTRR